MTDMLAISILASRFLQETPGNWVGKGAEFMQTLFISGHLRGILGWFVGVPEAEFKFPR